MVSEGKRPIVIDSGGLYLKVGFAGDSLPQIVLPNVIGFPKYAPIMTEVEHWVKYYYLCEEAMNLRGVLRLCYPVKRGLIADRDYRYRYPPDAYQGNWDALEKIWSFVLSEKLKIDFTQHPILMIVSPILPNSSENRIKSILLENMRVPAVQIVNSSTLSVSGAQRNTGLVVDSGQDITTIVPVVEGYATLHATQVFPIAGRAITQHLRRLIKERESLIPPIGNIEELRKMDVRGIKEELCFIAVNPEQESIIAEKGGLNEPFTIAGGTQLNIHGSIRFLAPELLFKPELMDINIAPIHEQVISSIENCTVDFKKDLYSNIILVGGSTMFPGLRERLQLEVTKRVPEDMKISVYAHPERSYLAWIGGSNLVSSKSFSEWITREEFEKKNSGVFEER